MSSRSAALPASGPPAVSQRLASESGPAPAILPLALPCTLLVAGAAVGYVFTLNPSVAGERLGGLVVASVLALVALVLLARTIRPAPVLYATIGVAALGALWIISATGQDVFRGPVGTLLQAGFRPLFGLAQLTDSVAVANTRFIVGYNGLADLCLVAVFCSAALLVDPPRPRRWPVLAVVLAAALLLLVGTGARGGLVGLGVGICLVGLVTWPRRVVIAALIVAPLALIVSLTLLDKGLEFSSTAGRVTFWSDLARLLVEYPLTGVGGGVDTVARATLAYEINPDPERIFYAHNTFVQSYLEGGPLAALGMLLVPVTAVVAAVLARTRGSVPARRPLLYAGLGIVGALTAHGLTDQVVTTNVGTGLLLLGLAATLATLGSAATHGIEWFGRGATVVVAALALLVGMAVAVVPSARAQALLNLGGLQLNQALALPTQDPTRAAALATAEDTLSRGLQQDPTQPAILRSLARVRSARYEDDAALRALKQAATSPRLDTFDILQIAHLYREFGFADEAYAWAARAYAAWGRPTEDAVMQAYAQSTLAVLDDFRARTLAEQAEAAMRARRFGEAQTLFAQALTFQGTNAYLRDRLGAAERAVAKYGPGDPAPPPTSTST